MRVKSALRKLTFKLTFYVSSTLLCNFHRVIDGGDENGIWKLYILKVIFKKCYGESLINILYTKFKFCLKFKFQIVFKNKNN